MKRSIRLFLATVFVLNITSIQAQKIYEKKATSNFQIDPNRVYNAHTGKKIEPKKFISMIQGKPFSIDTEIDSYGRIAKFLYDTTGRTFLKQPEENFEVGELFPPFNITTVRKRELSFDELRDKKVVVRFEMFADKYDFSNQALRTLENQMKAGKDEYVGVMFFHGIQEELDTIDTKGTTFHLVLQGVNFHQRYGITSFPTTILLDEQGAVTEIFRGSEKVDLKSLK
ncbi:TlpA family protein disulfide reductase [Ekhidna sp.]|uniref:TlpA family protein disulfide reductase n=1 Tax=Ekhidna sp. TaxID=2608089 RepID=UPI003CCC0258